MRASGRLFLALALTPAAPAPAETSRLDSILALRILKVGTTGDDRPSTTLDKGTGESSGLDIDLAHSLGAALGVKVAFVPTSWRSLAQDLARRSFDIAMGGISVTGSARAADARLCTTAEQTKAAPSLKISYHAFVNEKTFERAWRDDASLAELSRFSKSRGRHD